MLNGIQVWIASGVAAKVLANNIGKLWLLIARLLEFAVFVILYCVLDFLRLVLIVALVAGYTFLSCRPYLFLSQICSP